MSTLRGRRREDPARFPISLRTRGFRLDRDGVRAILRVSLEAEGILSPQAVGLLCFGDRTMRRLNREFRGKDGSTDVLSFPGGDDRGAVFATEFERAFLGDLAVSLPTCARQAAEQGVDPGEELLRLLVHGVLHLLGYDHIRAVDRRRMVPRERRARLRCTRLGLGPGLLRAERAR